MDLLFVVCGWREEAVPSFVLGTFYIRFFVPGLVLGDAHKRPEEVTYTKLNGTQAEENIY
jgi:hypothetical protein